MTALLAALATIYAIGTRRLWKTAGRGHGLRRWNVVSYATGLATIAIALFSPIDPLSDVLFAAHMTQHELLMVVAAPLVVLGKPFVAAMWALPAGPRARVAASIQRPVVLSVFRAISGPFVALVLHAAVLWAWHVPILFEAALADERVHAVQHATFFGSAALFFWALAQGRYGRAGYGVSVLYVFATAMHTSALGVILAVARRVVYPTYGRTAPSVGVDALQDQALAGLVMWIPAGLVFVVAALALFAAWLGEAARKMAREERKAR